MKIRELLSDKTKWCKGAFARDKEDKEVSAHNNSAVRWSLDGAMIKCYSDYIPIYNKIIDAIIKTTDYQYVASFNDDKETTFEDVKSILKKLDV